jgi:hypothetical protein
MGAGLAAFGLRPRFAPAGFSLSLATGLAVAVMGDLATGLTAAFVEDLVEDLSVALATTGGAALPAACTAGFLAVTGAALEFVLTGALDGVDFFETGTAITFFAGEDLTTGFTAGLAAVFATGFEAGFAAGFAADFATVLTGAFAGVLTGVLALVGLDFPFTLAAGLATGLANGFAGALATDLTGFLPEATCALTGFFGF